MADIFKFKESNLSVYCKGDMIVCAKFHDNHSPSCLDISVFYDKQAVPKAQVYPITLMVLQLY